MGPVSVSGVTPFHNLACSSYRSVSLLFLLVTEHDSLTFVDYLSLEQGDAGLALPFISVAT